MPQAGRSTPPNTLSHHGKVSKVNGVTGSLWLVPSLPRLLLQQDPPLWTDRGCFLPESWKWQCTAQSEAVFFDCIEWPSRCWDTFHRPHYALGRASLYAHWAQGLCSFPFLLPGQSNELGLSSLEWSGRKRTPSSCKITLKAMLHLFRGNYFSSPFRKKHTAKLTLPCSVTV